MMLTRVRGHQVTIGTTPTGVGTMVYVAAYTVPATRDRIARDIIRCAPHTPAGLGQLLTALEHA